MIKSKTKIERQLTNKTNHELVETIILSKKNPAWIHVAHVLTGPRRKRKGVNLNNIDKQKGDVVVAGKVLSQGEIVSKKKVVALNFSEKAKEKLKKAGCEVVLLKDEIKKNKEMKGVTLLK